MAFIQASKPRAPGLWFSIKINAEEFVVLLSEEALEKRFMETSMADTRAAYRKNRKLIDEVARRKFLQGCPRPITVEAEDFS